MFGHNFFIFFHTLRTRTVENRLWMHGSIVWGLDFSALLLSLEISKPMPPQNDPLSSQVSKSSFHRWGGKDCQSGRPNPMGEREAVSCWCTFPFLGRCEQCLPISVGHQRQTEVMMPSTSRLVNQWFTGLNYGSVGKWLLQAHKWPEYLHDWSVP